MESKNVTQADKSFAEREADDARKDIKRIDEVIEGTSKTGSVILGIASILTAVLAGKGFGTIVPDLLHQVGVGFIVFLLCFLLGKRVANSIPQTKPWLMYLYCGIMIFISAAFFVLGFVGDDPVRYCVSDDLNNMSRLTVKYLKEDQKLDDVFKQMNSYTANLRNDAKNEREYGTLTGTAGDNGVVYKTYMESAEFIEQQRKGLEIMRNDNLETISAIAKTINDFQTILWDKTLSPKEIQNLAYQKENELQRLFVSIKQNRKMMSDAAASIKEYSRTINDKRADKTNADLKFSQKDVLTRFKEKLVSFAENLEKSPFIDRDENLGTIQLSVHDVYLANLIQIPRYFYLWIAGIMLDIAAPLILYIIIGNYIKKRNELQEELRDHERAIELATNKA